MDLNDAMALAQSCGFSHYGPVNVPALRFLPEVRAMCAADKCGQYGRSWSCPPACGTLEEAADRARRCAQGVLVQTTGALEDDFDVEAMLEAERIHKERFFRLVDAFRARTPDCLPMAAGACTVCPACAYPESCRFPDRAIPSMEAYGIFVSQLCADSGLAYNYGPRTVTYTSCVLFNAE